MDEEEVVDRYLYVNKSCGTVIGIWPYGHNRLKMINRSIMILVAISSLITQVARVVVHGNSDAVVEQCPFIVTAFGIIMKEGLYLIYNKELKMLYGFMFSDWKIERPKSEIEIMDKYARRGRFFSNLYVGNGCFCMVIFSMVAMTPRILDALVPKNESRSFIFIYPAYYPFDERKYYYMINLHMFSVITVVFFVYITVDSIYINIVQHACGLLNVSGYRFKSAVKDYTASDEKGKEEMIKETYKDVCNSIKAHQYAIKFLMEIEEIHKIYLFIGIGLIMLSFSVTLVKTSSMDPCVEFYKYCGFLLVQLIHVLFLLIQGHFIILANDAVFDGIYAGMWYNSEPKIQALYALALRRNLTPQLLTAGGLMTLNLESFSEIIKASVSYFTVLKSS